MTRLDSFHFGSLGVPGRWWARTLDSSHFLIFIVLPFLGSGVACTACRRPEHLPSAGAHGASEKVTSQQSVGASGTGTRSGPPGLGSRSQLPLPPASVLVGGAVQSAAVSVQVFSFAG